MGMYRKKPVVVEAFQFLGITDPLPNGIFLDHEDDYQMLAGGQGRPYVITIHGQRTYIVPGDWIITEPDGKHHYPCKPNIFEATYVPAEETV